MNDTIKKAISSEPMTALFTAAKPLLEQMKSDGIGMVRITPDVEGRKFFSVILVCGEEEVGDVAKVLDVVETCW